MGRQNIYKTFSGASFMSPPMIEDVVEFLTLNRHFILPPEKKAEAFRSRSFGHSALSDLVYRLASSGADKAYSLIRLPSKTVSLREALDMTFVPIDLLQMKEMTSSSSKALSFIPELNDKLVINITDITKANGDFLDVSRFFQRVVRDFLSRNFYTSTGSVWISAALVRYVAKVYSMTIGGQLSRVFGLSPNVQIFIQSVFCAFFVSKMTSPDVANAFMIAHAKPMGLPQGVELSQILGLMKDTLGHDVPLTLDEVFKVIDAFDHDQMKNNGSSRLNRAVLNQRFASLAPENPVAMIALEYPPYFLYLIMQVLAGERIGLAFSMKNMNLLTEGKQVFEQIIRNPGFMTID